MASSSSASLKAIDALNFDNLVLRSLPVDPNPTNEQRDVPGAVFSRVAPIPLENPRLVALSAPALLLLDLDPKEAERPEFIEYFAGNRIIPGSEPAAHCYCGYQFGYFSGQLGDGATMYLGEIVNQHNERWELQFKGAGMTPYSRSADGRKVLRSSIREFLCSEAMHALGIPTTRAGTIVTSDSRVVRDIYYDGNPINERCTVITRIAPSFLRFGSFEIFKKTDEITGRAGPSAGREAEMLPGYINFVIATYFPEIQAAYADKPDVERYLEFYRQVVLRTALLVAEWQCAGFCHGVLNTDNMSILGLTLDYGPFGWLDDYDPDFICNGSDDGGRYAFNKQPEICRWNLEKLAEALDFVLPKALSLAELDKLYDAEFQSRYITKMRKKLGLVHRAQDDDLELVKSLLDTMHKTGADFTNTFRTLNQIPIPEHERDTRECGNQFLQLLLNQTSDATRIAQKCAPRIPAATLKQMLQLAQQDPRLLGLFGITHQQLLAEVQRHKQCQELLGISPEEKRAQDSALWSTWLESYKRRLFAELAPTPSSSSTSTSTMPSALAECSSTDAERHLAVSQERVRVMNSNNPRVVLRNYIAQTAIEAAEEGDYSKVQIVLKMLQNPYAEESPDDAELFAQFTSKPPEWASRIRVTCSS